MVWLPDYRNQYYVGIADAELRRKLDVLEEQFEVRGEHAGESLW